MKIAFDLRPLQIGHQNRGIGAYILNILERMPKNDGLTYIFLRYDSSNPIDKYNLGGELNYIDVVIKKRSFSKNPIKLLLYVYSNLVPAFNKLKRHKPDVFVQCDYLLGAPKNLRTKIITISYDLIPYVLRGYYLPSWRKYVGFRHLRIRSRVRLILHAWFYEQKYRNGIRLLKRSKRVISISKSTTSDLVRLGRVPENKISTIYPAASFRKNKQDVIIRDEIKELVKNLKGPTILYVGATDRRRQVKELIFAYNLYNAREGAINLLLGGKEFSTDSKSLDPKVKQEILSSSYSDTIHMLGKITEAEKKYLLENSSVFVYPTLYEGFGLPVLEAMEAGCPVITYRNSSLPEIADGAVLFTEEYGGYEIYISLCRILQDDKLASRLVKEGKAKAKLFNWENSANQFWEEIMNCK